MPSLSVPTEPSHGTESFEASIAEDTRLLPDVTKLLSTLRHVCNQPGISDFLFTSDPVHVPHLTTSSLSTTAFTCDLRITRAGFSPLQPDPAAEYAETHHFHARYLFLPSFISGHATAGVGVVESVETLGNSQLPKSLTTLKLFRNMRFVQDAKERWLLALMDSPDRERILMHNSDSRWSSTSRPHTFTAMFSRSKLLSAVQSSEKHVTEQLLLPALLGFMYTSQLRSCPICGANPGVSCTCYILSLPDLSNGPFDLQMFRKSMTMEMGLYQGISDKFMFCRGNQVRHIKLGAYSSIQGVYDPSSVRRLTTWALTKYASGVKEDPRQSCLLLSSGQDSSRSREEETHSEDEVPCKRLRFSEEVPEPLVDELYSISHGYPNGLKMTEGSMLYGITPGDVFLQGHQLEQTVNLMQTTSEKTLVASIVTKSDTAPAWWSQKWNNVETSAVEAVNSGVVMMGEQKPPSDNMGFLKQKPNVPTAVLRSIDSGNNQSVRDLMKQIRTEERKERNRASARRSNLKNRLQLGDLKKELQSSKAMIDKLRLKWLGLNEENLQLRASLETEISTDSGVESSVAY